MGNDRNRKCSTGNFAGTAQRVVSGHSVNIASFCFRLLVSYQYDVRQTRIKQRNSHSIYAEHLSIVSEAR